MDEKLGRFDIIRLLGRGGMAEVYLAHDGIMDREVAIKLLPRHFLHDPEFKARFEREAKVLARLDHPNVLPIYEFGYQGDQPYMVSRYMPEGSLEARLKHKGKLSLQKALAVLEQVCAALEAAHKKGIVHRDLKPGNILFDAEDHIYVADFGIAKLAESTYALTGTGGIVGTPAYMSPEQFLGDKELDGRSDQYSLGIVLFEMLSGELPFKAKSFPAMMHLQLTEPPPLRRLNERVPKEVTLAIQRALSKKPDQRYSSLKAFLTAVQTATGVKETRAGKLTSSEARAASATRLLPRKSSKKSTASRKLTSTQNTFLEEQIKGLKTSAPQAIIWSLAVCVGVYGILAHFSLLSLGISPFSLMSLGFMALSVATMGGRRSRAKESSYYIYILPGRGLKLSAPKQTTWVISLIIGGLGIFAHSGLLSLGVNPFVLVAIGFVVLAVASVANGL